MDKENHQFDDFFLKYRNMVIKNAYSVLKDYYAAEDICQETFIRLKKNMDRVDPDKVRMWLLRVSKRLAIDYLRKGGKRKVDVGLDGVRNIPADRTYFDLSSMLEEKEDRELMGSALNRLKKEKPIWYDAVLMSYVEGMDNRAIGEELGVKAFLVSTWKKRARQWLNKAYEENRKRDS